MRKCNFFLLLVIVIEMILALCISRDITFIVEYLPFAFCLIYWGIFSDNAKNAVFMQYVGGHKRIIYLIQLLYYIILLLSVIKGTGINANGWGISSLKGPYLINHLLAYELLVFIMLNLSFWIKKITFESTVLICLDFALIALTGVRGVFIALAIVFATTFITQRPQRQFLVGLIGVFVILYVFFETPLFSNLIEKTLYSAAMGSASSSRGQIFLSSLSAYFSTRNPIKWIGGVGHDYLIAYNREHIRMAIHSHNDFIDALVQYGIVGLTIYVTQLKRVCLFFKTKYQRTVFLLIIIALAGFNGFYMYQSINLATPILVMFVNSVSRKGLKKAHS